MNRAPEQMSRAARSPLAIAPWTASPQNFQNRRTGRASWFGEQINASNLFDRYFTGLRRPILTHLKRMKKSFSSSTERIRRERSLWKGAVAGIAAGVAATVVMTQFQNLWNLVSDRMKSDEDRAQETQQQEPQESDEAATSKVVGKIADLSGYNLSDDQKQKGGVAVHYGFGTTMGALYGVTMEMAPWKVKAREALAGLGFGAALFIGADEVMVPALGLSGKPGDQPFGSHLYGLTSHLVYGMSAEGIRCLVRRFL